MLFCYSRVNFGYFGSLQYRVMDEDHIDFMTEVGDEEYVEVFPTFCLIAVVTGQAET